MSDSVSTGFLFLSNFFLQKKDVTFLGRDYALLSEFPFGDFFLFLVFMSSAVMQKIRIILKSFDHTVVDEAAKPS